MKCIYVGDSHVQVNNLEDSEKLLQFILDTTKKENVDRLILLGDQYHTHAIKRVEVENFWDRWLVKLSNQCETVVLLGNHEKANQKDPGSENALEVHKRIQNNNLKIITNPTVMGNFAYIPYIHDGNEFIKIANTMAKETNTLICHQTFQGAEYENGFYAPDGIDATLLKHKCIISGHIHKQASLGKVWYPGTPRWLTSSDANEDKGIWLIEHKKDLPFSDPGWDGTFVSTWGVCTPIVSFTWSEGEEQPQLPERAISSIEIIGSQSFVNKGKEIFKGKAKIKTKVTDKIVRENRKASASVLDFLDKVYKTSVNKEKLKNYLVEKNYV